MLVAGGERSGLHLRRATTLLTERLQASRRGALSELVLVPGVGHGVHLEDPGAMAGLVRRLAALGGVAG